MGLASQARLLGSEVKAHVPEDVGLETERMARAGGGASGFMVPVWSGKPCNE